MRKRGVFFLGGGEWMLGRLSCVHNNKEFRYVVSTRVV